MKIVVATEADYAYIRSRDRHVLESLLLPKIRGNEIYLLQDDSEENIGWMRYSYFWDNTPFMNMLWLDEPYRGKGAGKKLVLYWEEKMREQGFQQVMTSTQADEGAQHFYRKLGYRDAGCLILEDQPLEILLTKALSGQ